MNFLDHVNIQFSAWRWSNSSKFSRMLAQPSWIESWNQTESTSWNCGLFQLLQDNYMHIYLNMHHIFTYVIFIATVYIYIYLDLDIRTLKSTSCIRLTRRCDCVFASQLSLRSLFNKKGSACALWSNQMNLKLIANSLLNTCRSILNTKTKIMIYFFGEGYMKDMAMLKGICVRQSNVYGKVCVSPIFFSRFGGPKRGYFKQILYFYPFGHHGFRCYRVGVFFVFSGGTGGFFHLTNRLTSKF